MSRHRISELDTWQDHEERVIEAIIEGLSILRSEEGLSKLKVELSLDDSRKIEDRINTVLCWCLNKATRQLGQRKEKGKRRGPANFPRPQTPKFPNPYDRSETSIGRERKIPDFKWGFVDHTSFNNPDNEYKGARDFDIECKRLGKKIPSGALTQKYVQNGILRFITNEHRYGEDESSGAMIGYVENMGFDNILSEVNEAIASSSVSLPPLSKPSEGWQEHATSRLDHEFGRSFPETPFHLYHFWIDLRGCYIQSS